MIIYALMDPRTSCLRYVGKAVDVERRLKVHLHEKAKTLKNNWLKSLKAKGLKPALEVLEEVDGDGSDAERFWIASLRAAGARLLNATDGGDGFRGRHSEETKARMRAAHLGMKMPADGVEKARRRHLGAKRPQSTKDKLREVALKFSRKRDPATGRITRG